MPCAACAEQYTHTRRISTYVILLQCSHCSSALSFFCLAQFARCISNDKRIEPRVSLNIPSLRPRWACATLIIIVCVSLSLCVWMCACLCTGISANPRHVYVIISNMDVFNLNFNAAACIRLEWTNFRHILRAQHELAKMKSTQCGVRTSHSTYATLYTYLRTSFNGFICQVVYLHLSLQFSFQSFISFVVQQNIPLQITHVFAFRWIGTNEWMTRTFFTNPPPPPLCPLKLHLTRSFSFAFTLLSVRSLFAHKCTPPTTSHTYDAGTIARAPSHILCAILPVPALRISCVSVCAVSFATASLQNHFCSSNILWNECHFIHLKKTETERSKKKEERKKFPT